jgi:hypothetical protein
MNPTIETINKPLEDSSEIYRCYIKELRSRKPPRNEHSYQGSLHLLTHKSDYEMSFDRPARAEVQLKVIQEHYENT